MVQTEQTNIFHGFCFWLIQSSLAHMLALIIFMHVSACSFNKYLLIVYCMLEIVSIPMSLFSVLVRILQRNRTNLLRIYKIGIGSCNYGSWEVPQSAICNQEIQWYNLVWGQRPENQAATSVSPRVQRFENKNLQCPSAEKHECPSSRKQKKNSPLLHLFVPLRSSKNWMIPTHIGEGRSLNQVYWIKY